MKHTVETNAEAAARHLITSINIGDLGTVARQLVRDTEALNVHRYTPTALAQLASRLALMTKIVAEAAADANQHRANCGDVCAKYQATPGHHADVAHICQTLASEIAKTRMDLRNTLVRMGR
jgi:hypothetical protein